MAEDIKPDITGKETLHIQVGKLEDTLRKALDKHTPVQTKSVMDRLRVPRFTENVRDTKKWMRHGETYGGNTALKIYGLLSKW